MSFAGADWKPKVIVVASPKGGCAKTTTVVGLAGAAIGRGYVIDLLDTDVAQRSLADWLEGHNRAKVTVLRPQAVASRVMASAVQLIFVDTAGADAPMIGAALVAADLVLIPMSDSILEVGPAVRLYSRLKQQGKAARIVMSCVDRVESLRVERARSLTVAASCLESVIPRRVAVKDACAARQLFSENDGSIPVHERFISLIDGILPIVDFERGAGHLLRPEPEGKPRMDTRYD